MKLWHDERARAARGQARALGSVDQIASGEDIRSVRFDGAQGFAQDVMRIQNVDALGRDAASVKLNN